MDTLSQSLTRFSKYLETQSISSYSFHCDITDCYTCQNYRYRSSIKYMPYFGALNSMSVHLHFYITHEASCESLYDLEFRNQCFTTYCNVWPPCTTIFSSILKLSFCFNMHIASILLFQLGTPPRPCTKLVYHTYLSLTIKYQTAIIFINKSIFMIKLSIFCPL